MCKNQPQNLCFTDTVWTIIIVVRLPQFANSASKYMLSLSSEFVLYGLYGLHSILPQSLCPHVPKNPCCTVLSVCNKCTSSYLGKCAHMCCCMALTDCCTDFFLAALGCMLLLFLGNVPFLLGDLFFVFNLPLFLSWWMNVLICHFSLFLYFDFVTIFNNYLI